VHAATVRQRLPDQPSRSDSSAHMTSQEVLLVADASVRPARGIGPGWSDWPRPTAAAPCLP
jgi:hypothetical protein